MKLLVIIVVIGTVFPVFSCTRNYDRTAHVADPEPPSNAMIEEHIGIVTDNTTGEKFELIRQGDILTIEPITDYGD